MKRIALSVLVLILTVVAASGIYDVLRESKVRAVGVGITRAEVERLLGPGAPDTSPPACKDCPHQTAQMYYRANPSFWYGRFEDSLIVCYDGDRVCGISRYGL
jgi:hypothetical protein